MNLYERIISKQESISIVGLGYVGLPIAIAFARKTNVIGFDTNTDKIALYKKGLDPTNEVGDDAVKETSIEFTSDSSKLSESKFIIVAVPTPIKKDKTPDLSPVEKASETIARNLQKGAIIVYESTVYPGVTEDICIPILEKYSGLKCGIDFKIGYSPERINPGDKVHRLETITKIVSGMDKESLEIIAKVYELVVEVGVYRAESIKVAEAAKVIENSQRDINIAFMNELSIIFNKLGIDTKAVLAAAGTKWNFLKFTPGLVGGHCIGVDPYYLTYKAQEVGYNSQIILSGRRINDNMGKYVAENTVKNMIREGRNINGARVGILGLTFKENTPDIRNTRVTDIIDELEDYGVEVLVSDPYADKGEVENEYGFTLHEIEEMKDLDAIVVAVMHDKFDDINLETLKALYAPNIESKENVLIDVKGVFNREEAIQSGYNYWRL